jgi:hypothetical protein
LKENLFLDLFTFCFWGLSHLRPDMKISHDSISNKGGEEESVAAGFFESAAFYLFSIKSGLQQSLSSKREEMNS